MDCNTAQIRRVDRPEEDTVLVALDRLRCCPEELVPDNNDFWPHPKRKRSKKKPESFEEPSLDPDLNSRDDSPRKDSPNEEIISATNQRKDKQQKKDSRQGVSVPKHSQQSSTVRDVATESLRETPTSNEVSEDPGGTWTHRLRCRPK